MAPSEKFYLDTSMKMTIKIKFINTSKHSYVFLSLKFVPMPKKMQLKCAKFVCISMEGWFSGVPPSKTMQGEGIYVLILSF